MRRVLIYIFLITASACSNINNSSDCNLFVASGSYAIVKQLTDPVSGSVSINAASSGVLARQIYSGADADIYISANREWVDYLIDSGYISNNDTQVLCNDRLAIITSADNSYTIDDFYSEFKEVKSGFIAVGNPEFVPAGKYAFQFFRKKNLLASAEDKLLLAKSVSDVLKYVEIRECKYGIVYLSMAKQSQKIRIVDTLPQSMHNRVEFIICKLNNRLITNTMYNMLLSDSCRDIIESYGFYSVRDNKY